MASPCKTVWRAALFFDPEMSFSRPRDWSILFSAAACLFFDLQLFFSPAMRPRKRAQSFFQPLCIILSSLFLGPETSCSEPGSFFEPRDIFSGPPVLFFDLCRRDAHTRRDEKQIANQELGKLGNKSQARKNKETKLHVTDNKIQKNFFSHTTRRQPREKRFRGLKAMKIERSHARDNKNKHHNEETTRKALQRVKSNENKLKGATRKRQQTKHYK